MRLLMRMRLPFLLLVSMLMSVTACSVEPDAEVVDNAKNSVDVNSDIAIASALYLDRRTPDGFYQEDYPDDLFTSLSHVKNTTILAPGDRAGLSVYELSSNDFVEAMSWDEQATAYQPLYSQLVDTIETDLYYQFTRVNPDLPEFIDISRVFKASAIDRSGVDRSDEEAEYQGKITLAVITAIDIKRVVEYLWTFSFSNNYSNAVLESYTTETENDFVHIMKQAKINFSHSEDCDTVEINEVRYAVAKDSGLIWRDKVLLRSFLAKRNGSLVEVCK